MAGVTGADEAADCMYGNSLSSGGCNVPRAGKVYIAHGRGISRGWGGSNESHDERRKRDAEPRPLLDCGVECLPIYFAPRRQLKNELPQVGSAHGDAVRGRTR